MAIDHSRSQKPSRSARILTTPAGDEINSLFANSPKLAAEKALNIINRPTKMFATKEQRLVLDTANKKLVTINGIGIQTYIWENKKSTEVTPSVLLAHGYGGCAAQMLSFVKPLGEHSFRVVAWDQIAHGDSEGDWADLSIVKQTVLVMAQLYSPLAGFVGHSGGATTALAALIEESKRGPMSIIRCPTIVCLSPRTQNETLMAYSARRIGFDPEILPLVHQAIAEQRIIMPGHIREVLAQYRAQSSRLLIIQDQNDKMATTADAEYLANAIPSCTLEFTNGLGHLGGLTKDHVVRLAVSFMVTSGIGTETARL